MRSRLTVALLSLGLMVGGTGGVIAAKGGDKGNSGAAKSQYKPGVGPCKKGGTTPSGQHTGAPGNDQNCANKPGGGTDPSSPGNSGDSPGGGTGKGGGKGNQ